VTDRMTALLNDYRNAVALRAVFEFQDRGLPARSSSMLDAARSDEEKALGAIVTEFSRLRADLLSAKDALAALGRMLK
jgi:hypothetical protein